MLERDGDRTFSARVSLGRASRVYANTTVASLVREVLGRYRLAVVREHGGQGDYRVACADDAALREYLVQYDESDFALLQGRPEHEGLSYWLEHEVPGEVILVSDDPRTGPFVSGSPTLRYRGRNNLDPGKKGLVWGLDFAQRRVPARVVVADYNEDNPALLLRAEAAVEGGPGFGTALLYGEDFRDVEAGQALAAVRAEALACRRRVCEGRSCGKTARCGRRRWPSWPRRKPVSTASECCSGSDPGARDLVAVEHHRNLGREPPPARSIGRRGADRTGR